MTGWPVVSLCQMAAVRARRRCRTRTVTPPGVWPPWRSRSSWPLKVSLTDSMTWRSGLKNRAPAWARARLGGRAQQAQPGRRQDGLGGEHGEQGLAPVSLGAGQGEGHGRPCRVQTRCGRNPQKYRECEAQYPYSAHPARSERFAVPRERPHSTRVESTTQTSSVDSVVPAARTRMQCRISAAAPRSRLLYGLLRQVREQVPQVRVRVPQPPGHVSRYNLILDTPHPFTASTLGNRSSRRVRPYLHRTTTASAPRHHRGRLASEHKE